MQKYIDAAFSSRPVMPLKGAEVKVTTSNGDLATLYSDNAGTLMGNPIYTDDAGNYSFYAADGRYTITISKTGFQTQVISDVLLEDPADGSAAIADPSGSSLIGFIGVGTGAVSSNVQAVLRERVTPQRFGAVGNGTTDDTAAFQAAMTFCQSNGITLQGVSGSNYKITAKIQITAGNTGFNGNNCLVTNGISNATAADPIFEISNSSASNVYVGNFRVYGTANNGHIVAVIGALATGPQFITVERIFAQSNAGNGKDYTGAAMPAQTVYCYGGMTIRVNEVVSYMGGGLYFDNTLKIYINGVTIDTPAAGRLMYLNACNGVIVSGTSVFNGGVSDQIEVVGCKGVLVQGNRLKGSNGRQFYAHGSSSNVVFRNNQQEVYSLTSNAVEITTAVAGAKACENVLAFINGSGSPVTFTNSGIAIVDEPGGGYISAAAEISGNGFILNSLMTVTNLISAGSSLNSIRSLKIASNSLAAPGGGSGSVATNGVNLTANVIGAEIACNQYGATSGNTMTNGINIAAGCTGTRLFENYNFGNCTNPIVDSGAYTTRREGGALVANTFTPVISGTTTAGTGTYTTQTGAYVLDGKIATIGIQIVLTAHTGTGSMTVNLPFSTANRLQSVHVLADSLTYTGQLCAAVSAGDSKIRIWSETSGGGLAQLSFDTAFSIYLNGVLEVA